MGREDLGTVGADEDSLSRSAADPLREAPPAGRLGRMAGLVCNGVNHGAGRRLLESTAQAAG